jgi:hypothetical protein
MLAAKNSTVVPQEHYNCGLGFPNGTKENFSSVWIPKLDGRKNCT